MNRFAKWMLAVALLAMPFVAGAQTANISATIVDQDGTTWAGGALGGTYAITLLPGGPGTPYRSDTGQNIQTSFSGALSGSGTFSATLTDVNFILPANSTWQFKVCPQVYNAPCVSVNIPVIGSFPSGGDVSSIINALAAGPRVSGGPGVFAYADVEVAQFPNNSYYNVTTPALRCYGSSWGVCGSGGASGVTNIATTGPITGGPITSTGTIACATCVVATSPGLGIAHFAGSTQTVTSSLVSLTADVSGVLPIANGGTGSATAAQNSVLAGPASGGAGAPSFQTAPTFNGSNITNLSGGNCSACALLASANSFSALNTFPGGDLFLGGVNTQTGTTYAFVASDENKVVTFSNAASVAVNLSQATTTGFTSGFYVGVLNLGAGTVTITPTTSTINGDTTLTLATGQSAIIWSNGTNYVATGAYSALTNQANTFSASQTVNSGFGLILNGSRQYTISSSPSASAISFTGTSTGTFAWIRDNTIGAGGVGTLLNAGAFFWSTSATATSSTALYSPSSGVVGVGTSAGTPSGTLQAKLYQAGVGTQLTAAATIAPTSQIHHITGATQITTITAPADFSGGQITLIPDDASGQSTGTGGNIALASTLVQHKALTLTYDGTNWYPSY